MANTSEEKVPANASDKPAAKSGHKTVSALAIFALGLNAAAAVYTTSPADFTLPDVSRLAELLPHQAPFSSTPDNVVATLKDIQSEQLWQTAALQANGTSLQQNTALLQQDSATVASLRQTITDEGIDVKKISEQITDEHSDVKKVSAQITDEHLDVKKMSDQISTLIAKVDTLQRTVEPATTSSIPKVHARARLVGHKRMARTVKPTGAISLSGAPFTTAPASSSQGSPEG